MKRFAITGLILSVLPLSAIAACNDPAVSFADLPGLLSGKTACAVRGSEQWQEFHDGLNGGNVVDYKKGPNDPVDPSEKVGTWSVSQIGQSGRGQVTYNYGAGGAYSYTVHSTGGNPYTFCGSGSAPTLTVTLQPGSGGCGVAASSAARSGRR